LKDDNIGSFFEVLSGQLLELMRKLEYPIPEVLLLQLEYDLTGDRFSQIACWDRKTGDGYVYTTDSGQWFRATQ
jgi:hypothetical protein